MLFQSNVNVKNLQVTDKINNEYSINEYSMEMSFRCSSCFHKQPPYN